jgi:O-antigen/teichoic acid export membrane protein
MFLERLKHFNKSHAVTVFKGNFISKLILVIGGLFLAKFYGSDEYGTYSIYLSISVISSTFITFGLDHLITLSTNKDQIENNFKSINILSLIFTFLLLLIFTLFNSSSLSIKTYFVGIMTGYFIQFTNNTKFFLAKEKKFKKITYLTITDAGVSFTLQAIFLFTNIKNGLITGSLIGFSIAFLLSLFYVRNLIQIPNYIQFFENIKKRKDLITISYPSTLINTLGNNIMPILIASYFIPKIVGEYSLANKILSIPLLLISSSIATVYYPKAVELYNSSKKETLIEYTKKISTRNFIIIIILYILINSIGIFLLKILYNKNWENLGSFVFLLSFGFLSRSLINPVADIFTILKKNKITLIFNLYLLFSNFLSIYLGKQFGFLYLVGIFSLLLSIGYGYLFYFIIYHLNKNHESHQEIY